MGQTSCHRWKKESENVRKRNGESAGRGGREREKCPQQREKAAESKTERKRNTMSTKLLTYAYGF